MLISIYGDSILKSVVYENGAYRTERDFAKQFSRRYEVQVENRSYFGSTSDKALRRMQRDLKAEKPLGKYCVIEFGGNDCAYDWEAVSAAPEEEHEPFTPPETFRENLRRLAELVRSHRGIPVLTNLPPIDAKRYYAWITRRLPSPEPILRWIGRIERFYQQNEFYSLLCAKIAAETGTIFADIRSPFLRRNDLDGLLCEDGMHPNREGHRRILEVLCGLFEEKEMAL